MSKSYVSMILSVAAALVACAASASIEFSSSGAKLRLSERCGAVESLVTADGAERVVPAAEAFTLQLLDGKGEPTRFKSSEFAFEPRVTFAGGGRGATALPVGDGRAGSPCPPLGFTWRHANGLVVKMMIEAGDGEFRFTPSVEGIPAGMLLEWFDGPQVYISSDRTLYWPYWDGGEIADYAHRPYSPSGFVKRFSQSRSCTYPERCQMQFMAAYRDGEGVYFSAVDNRHTPKAVEWERVDDRNVRLSLQTFCGDLDAEGAWRPKFYYSLRPYEGGWMEACEIYRCWVRTLPGFEKPPKRPKWMYDSPVNLIYPVRGEGRDKGRDMKPNRYFPYVNAMSAVVKYGKLLDSRVMALLMHWEGTAPWAPPYVWPPYGGEAELAKFRDALHARGDLLGVYCSGTAWTQISSIIPEYSQEQKFVDEGLWRYMVRGPKGEITARSCNGHDAQRLGYDMCLAEDWPIRTVDEEVGKMARFGIDYCQFFDQNLGGGWRLCYARHHRHPPIPGAWATEAMSALQNRLVATAGRHGMLLGCESAAATPYVPNLFYNDSRPMIILMNHGRPVPGIAFVFHEWQCNFSGNMCVVEDGDPFWRWTYCFHQGDMLSLILGADDRIVSAWMREWRNDPFPEQDELVPLVKRFNDIRKKHPSFLLEGRMIRPFVKCESRPVTLSCSLWGVKNSMEVEEVLTSFWENAKGERIGFASNWRREPSELKITYADGRAETRVLAPLETIVLQAR